MPSCGLRGRPGGEVRGRAWCKLRTPTLVLSFQPSSDKAHVPPFRAREAGEVSGDPPESSMSEERGALREGRRLTTFYLLSSTLDQPALGTHETLHFTLSPSVLTEAGQENKS